MADFKTHIGTSTLVGIGYGLAGYSLLEVPATTAIVSAGLCSVAGMLPDLDSDTGRPLRETVTFAAAVVPMLMVDRFQQLGLSNESMVLATGLVYIVIRFVLAEVFRRYTVHRGMWHSIPAAITVGLATFLIVHCDNVMLRMFKTMAVVLGFMTHLVLDELWSIEMRGGRIRFKKSFGTAMKFWGNSPWANFSTYSKLVLFAAWAATDPYVMEQYGQSTRAEAATLTAEADESAVLLDESTAAWDESETPERVGERVVPVDGALR